MFVELKSFLALVQEETEKATSTPPVSLMSLAVNDTVFAFAHAVGEWDRVVVTGVPSQTAVRVRSLDYGTEYDADDIRYLTENLAKYPVRAQHVYLSGKCAYTRMLHVIVMFNILLADVFVGAELLCIFPSNIFGWMG